MSDRSAEASSAKCTVKTELRIRTGSGIRASLVSGDSIARGLPLAAEYKKAPCGMLGLC